MHPSRRFPTLARAAAVLSVLSASTVGAQARRLTHLLGDPVPGTLIVNAAPARVGNTVFFPGWDPKNQYAMWASDGSSSRATLLRGTRAQTPVSFGGRAFFIGSDPTLSRLWTSDGSPDGTQPVADLGGIAPAQALTAAKGALYMAGGDGRPWTSDGSAAGTVRLTEHATLGSYPGFVDWNGSVWFLAVGDDGHLGLWSTTGTPQSTEKAADLDEAVLAGRFGYGLAAFGDRLYLYTSQQPYGSSYRLWSSDGTSAGTTALHDFSGTFGYVCPGPCFGTGPETLAPLGGQLVFFADDGVHGRQLWKTDGTGAGTLMFAVVSPSGVNTSFLTPGSSAAAGSYALFAADDGVHGNELWRTDGTAAGTYMLVDLAPGPDDSYPSGFVAVGDQFFFTASHARPGPAPQRRAIWRTDGTASGTVIFRDEEATLYQLEEGFAAVETTGLWTSDGTAFILVDDLARARGLDPLGLTPFGAGVAFTRIDDDNSLHDLWRYDATSGTADVVRHFASLGSLPRLAGTSLYFGADDGVHGIEPWVSDGTAAHTHLLKDIATSPNGLESDPNDFTAASGLVFFIAWENVHGVELWETDGTDAGTRIVEDFNPGPDGSVPQDLTPFQGTLAFTIAYPSPGGLWRTDDTLEGTSEIAPVPASQVVASGSVLYFVGFDGALEPQLWTSDGTGPGTRPIHTFGGDYNRLVSLTAAGERVFFVAQAALHEELWVSDGSDAGTLRLGSFALLNELTAVNDSIFFQSIDEDHGLELWASDGTPGGTRLVRDIARGPASSSPSSLTAIAGRVFFAADDGVHGIEPWVSDGTERGTFLLEDLSPGAPSSSPEQFVLQGGTVYFRASDDEAGAQIWSMAADANGSLPPRGRPRDPRVVPPRN